MCWRVDDRLVVSCVGVLCVGVLGVSCVDGVLMTASMCRVGVLTSVDVRADDR